jgi:excinuclease ABC A subunit
MTKHKASPNIRSAADLEIIGADANNLQNIDVRIPLHRVTMVIGVSGSGKSSLLEDTLAVEAGRRMRTFLGIRPPHMDGAPPRAFIGPLPAAVHLGQRTFRASARTTVGTATGLLTTLRRLFLIAGHPYSDKLRRAVPAPSAALYAEWLARHYKGHATAWAAPVRFSATDGVRTVERLRQLGLEQAIIRSETDTRLTWEKGRVVHLSRFKPLDPQVRHIIEARIGDVDIGSRTKAENLRELLERAFAAGNGTVVVELPGATQPELQGPFGPRLDSTLHYVDPEDAACFAPPGPHLLTFNAPEHSESGACRTCRGLGRSVVLNEEALIPHPERSLHGGAFALWTEKNYKHVNIQHETIEGLRGIQGFSPDIPWRQLPEAARRLVLDGSDGALVVDRERGTGRKKSAPRPFEGFRRAILERVARGTKVAQSLAFLVHEGPCESCGGTRWSFQARALRVCGYGIHQFLQLPFSELAVLCGENGQLAKDAPPQARPLLRRLHQQSQALVSVGLSHLTGDRGMLEVSGGEGRRTQLASVLSARNTGLCLLLDEPARGLHDEDLTDLSIAIASLTPAHTVVMNEHRHALVQAADYLVQLGPKAGPAGGRVEYQGPVTESPWEHPPRIERTRTIHEPSGWLTFEGAALHNLRNVRCRLPLGKLTCLTGVSGSGKSSFVRGVLAPAVLAALGQPLELEDFDMRRGSWTRFSGAKQLTGLVALDQKVPATNRRSIVATFLEVAERLRTVFGTSEDARASGLTVTDFGLNAGRGRCQLCLGLGEVEEHDLWTICPACGGMRYGQEALSVHVEGLSINELLALPISSLRERLPSFMTPYSTVLDAMVELGIGHISMGRRVDTLSGGEVQRLRIARKLAEHTSGGLLFVLDEPAAGLHPSDVAMLVRALDRILAGGRNTIVLVEHNPAIIAAADWLIEFGPGGGPAGGQVTAEGSPEQVRKTDTATGRVLAGRSIKAHSRRVPTRVEPAQASAPITLQQAARVKTWIRQLIGDDVTPPAEPEPTLPEHPAVILDEDFWRDKRPWELGDLDHELARLLLDTQLHRPRPEDIDALAAQWAQQGDDRLYVHPFLRELQVWGIRLPRSAVNEALQHARAMGLEVQTPDGNPLKKGAIVDWRHVRATGERFLPRAGSPEERRRAISDALLLGAGRVELRGPRMELRASLQSRLMDLEQGLVGPMEVSPFHFSRHDPRGRCPMCKGSGVVMALKQELIIGDRRAAIEDEGFLHPAASAVMKSVRRAEMLPFFRRMSQEGLWHQEKRYQDLDEAARHLLLYGCWTRPGPGTFLKDSKADASEVNSWLRWDGLYHHVMGQLERSTDMKWKEAVVASRASERCPSCQGTGLAPAARLLALGGRSLQQWVEQGELRELCRALEKLETSTKRRERMRQRLLACLAPLANEGSMRMSMRVDAALAHEVGRRIIEGFTNMPTVIA